MNELNEILGLSDVKQPHVSVSKGNGFFSLEGRSRRREYWGVALIFLGVCLFVVFPLIFVPIVSTHHGRSFLEYPAGILCVAIGITLAVICSIMMIPVTVRRLHDRNMSGWWLLLFWVLGLIPFIGGIVGIVQFIIIGCLDGTNGANDFGADPKNRHAPQKNGSPSITDCHYDSAPEDRLLKLAKLKEMGILSNEEYEEKRRKFLSEI